MNKHITLKTFEVNEEVFNKILESYKDYLVLFPSVDKYKFGYSETDMQFKKKFLAYNNNDEIIMYEYQLSAVLDDFSLTQYNYTDIVSCDNCWKQCIVRRRENVSFKVEKSMGGTDAYRLMMIALEHHYTKDEIEKLLYEHEAEYDESLKQIHFTEPHDTEDNKIYEYDNCYYYDMNSAYGSALIEIFPKARGEILEMYQKRKSNPRYKQIMNFFVGMLCRKGHRKTNNWIVQRTTKIVQAFADNLFDITKSDIIYFNTDGFIIQNPTNIIPSSNKIGEFKIEYTGKVRFYREHQSQCSYYVFEFDREKERIKGNLPITLRNNINLKERKVVHFDKYKEDITESNYIWKYKNITTEEI